MMLLSNVVHLTLFRMGTLLVKSYEVYCEVLNRVWFALVVKISLECEIDIYYWCHYIEYRNSLLLNTGGKYKSHWDRLSMFVLDARNVTIFVIEPTICIVQWSWKSFSDRYLNIHILMPDSEYHFRGHCLLYVHMMMRWDMLAGRRKGIQGEPLGKTTWFVG
jgi:hypothetical protein